MYDYVWRVRFDSLDKLNQEIEKIKKEGNYEVKVVSPVETWLRKTNEVLVFLKEELTMEVVIR